MSSSPDLHSPPGVVELREDVPLKPNGINSSGRLCSGGPRFILAAFAALSIAITIALLTQIYYGDYEVVPHGSVSSSAAACSSAGTAAMQAGGRAIDAAAATALCLAVIAPHRTSLDACESIAPAKRIELEELQRVAAHRVGRLSIIVITINGNNFVWYSHYEAQLRSTINGRILDRNPSYRSGSLVYWEYRSSRSQLPTVVEWGGVEVTTSNITKDQPPRLLDALAALHSRFGVLTWSQALQPAIDLAREGYAVSNSLSTAAEERGLPGYVPQALRTEPALADYLETLQHNSSSELCSAWSCTTKVRWIENAVPMAAGRWSVWTAGVGGMLAAKALHEAFAGDPLNITAANAFQGVIKYLQAQLGSTNAWPGGVASGVAVVDPRDTYVALVTGLSVAFGSDASTSASTAWIRDEPTVPLDLAPALIMDQNICGTRYIMGAESGEALAEGAAQVLAGGGADAVKAVESARVLVLPGGNLSAEPGRPPPDLPGIPLVPLNSSIVLPSINFVQQKGDALLSHADSRGGGVASRF